MFLKHLSLTNFRKFTRLDLDFPQRPVLLTGANAQGKTTVLEAIYFLAAFTSFQTNTDRQLINFDEADKKALRLVAAHLGKSQTETVRVLVRERLASYSLATMPKTAQVTR